jgi:hypothetical protein
MKKKDWILTGFVILLAGALLITAGCGKKKDEEKAETQVMEESEMATPAVELPAAVSEVIDANFPDAEIDVVEMTEEAGITFYDIEFKDDGGEIEVAADGTILDITTIITTEELPGPVASAITVATAGMTVTRLEKSEVYSKINLLGPKPEIVALDPHKLVYEAELMKDDISGEIAFDAGGNIVEALKWDAD